MGGNPVGVGHAAGNKKGSEDPFLLPFGELAQHQHWHL